jgi:hypothetical protein
LAVVRGLPGQILFLVPSLQLVVVLEQTATQEAAARVEVQSQPQLEVEHQGKATMAALATTTAQAMLLALEEVALVQLV